MDIISSFKEKVKQRNLSVVLPEGRDERIIEAALRLSTEGIARPIVLGEPEQIEVATEKAGVGLDCILDADEIAKANESLKKFDKNGDGKLTSDEYRPQCQGGPGGPGMHSEDFRPGGRGGYPPVEGQRPALQRPSGDQ